jgi:hypothetical protein
MEVIGRKDLVSFPAFGLFSVPVKIDSGAYTSSMHCSKIELIGEGENAELHVIFLDEKYQGFTGKEFVFNKFKEKRVKSSNGQSQLRYFITGTIRIFNKDYETLFSLTQRTGLRNPILLGRKLLNKRFLIDSSKINCSFEFEKQKIQSK